MQTDKLRCWICAWLGAFGCAAPPGAISKAAPTAGFESSRLSPPPRSTGTYPPPWDTGVPKGGSRRPLALPGAKHAQLENGLQILCVTNNRLPIVSLRVFVGAGAADDEAGSWGEAKLVASIVERTSEIAGSSATPVFCPLGLSVETSTTQDYSSLTVEVPSNEV